ncbi:flagellar basal-body MS-ring/collar protein FliF [Caldicoprobacter faecalis]|uniref:Flagellar M-ring protein n=1 Tax=Caldicoprobacter faecalis TaxID=937334 RepID=A0A1I5RL72_9FIRM|nr:flagellar basal-body MS-ring/collar protein FliF [Caldicoprobacter faecalis]SFP59233.1 flagellar M-ring protein FliF [Caldicoprobacter faecalis]
MALALDTIKQQLNQYWERLSSAQKKAFIIITSVVLLIIVIAALLLSRQEYVVLYSGLDSQETAEIYSKLKELNVEPKVEGTSTILVPKDKEVEVRMQLTSEGYPRTGFNYDLFLQNSNFGQTDEEKRALLIMQLQERLSQAIKFLDGVEDAVVTIAMPENDVFVLKSQQVPVTASVIIKTKPGYTITPSQANNIVRLVAKSVPGLKEENVTVVDTNMNVLTGNQAEGEEMVGTQFELEHRLEDRIRDQIINLLEPVFGYKKVVATVNVKLNFDKKTTESVRFEPVVDEDGIIASREVLREKVRNAVPEGVVGETSNTTQYPELEGAENGSYDKTHEIVNYEVNEIKEILEEQQGKVEDLSISVIIDNESLDPQILGQVKELVAAAVGTDVSRVVVQNMKFDTSLQEQLLEGFERRQAERMGWQYWAVPVAVGVGIAIAAVLLMRMRSRRVQLEAATAEEILTQEAQQPAPQELEIQQPTVEELEITDKHNEIKKQIEKLVSQQPEAVAQLLRNWLSEE